MEKLIEPLLIAVGQLDKTCDGSLPVRVGTVCMARHFGNQPCEICFKCQICPLGLLLKKAWREEHRFQKPKIPPFTKGSAGGMHFTYCEGRLSDNMGYAEKYALWCWPQDFMGLKGLTKVF